MDPGQHDAGDRRQRGGTTSRASPESISTPNCAFQPAPVETRTATRTGPAAASITPAQARRPPRASRCGCPPVRGPRRGAAPSTRLVDAVQQDPVAGQPEAQREPGLVCRRSPPRRRPLRGARAARRGCSSSCRSRTRRRPRAAPANTRRNSRAARRSGVLVDDVERRSVAGARARRRRSLRPRAGPRSSRAKPQVSGAGRAARVTAAPPARGPGGGACRRRSSGASRSGRAAARATCSMARLTRGAEHAGHDAAQRLERRPGQRAPPPASCDPEVAGPGAPHAEALDRRVDARRSRRRCSGTPRCAPGGRRAAAIISERAALDPRDRRQAAAAGAGRRRRPARRRRRAGSG